MTSSRLRMLVEATLRARSIPPDYLSEELIDEMIVQAINAVNSVVGLNTGWETVNLLQQQSVVTAAFANDGNGFLKITLGAGATHNFITGQSVLLTDCGIYTGGEITAIPSNTEIVTDELWTGAPVIGAAATIELTNTRIYPLNNTLYVTRIQLGYKNEVDQGIKLDPAEWDMVTDGSLDEYGYGGVVYPSVVNDTPIWFAWNGINRVAFSPLPGAENIDFRVFTWRKETSIPTEIPLPETFNNAIRSHTLANMFNIAKSAERKDLFEAEAEFRAQYEFEMQREGAAVLIANQSQNRTIQNPEL